MKLQKETKTDCQKHSLREKCPNTEFLLICTRKKKPYFDTFHAVILT